MEQDWLSTTDISNTSASSSTSENPHDPTEDDYHEVGLGWDDNDEEKEGEGEMDEGDDQEETDTASFNLELSTTTSSQNEFSSGSKFTSIMLNPSLISSFYLELAFLHCAMS